MTTYQIEYIQKIASSIIGDFPDYRIFCFQGELGAGKTTLIEAICRFLGSQDMLSSPTFSIVNEYQAPQGILYHMDWYRLQSVEEAIDSGLEEILYSGHYCFIEWHTQAESIIPRPYVLVTITTVDEFTRTIHSEIVAKQ